MKKTFLYSSLLFLVVCAAGFTVHKPASGKHAIKKSFRINGPAWIACNHGYIHTCGDLVERYYVRDGEAGDTYEWYWDPYTPGFPTQYLGSNNYADVAMSEGDVLTLVVHSEYNGTYEYWDTAPPCEQ